MKQSWRESYSTGLDSNHPLPNQVAGLLGFALESFIEKVGHEVNPAGLSMTLECDTVAVRTMEGRTVREVATVTANIHYEEDHDDYEEED